MENAACHAGKNLADAVERKQKQVSELVPRYLLFLPLAMSTCGEVGSDVHALIKELAIRRVEHKSETHSNESQHLAEGTEVARLHVFGGDFLLFYSRHFHSARDIISAGLIEGLAIRRVEYRWEIHHNESRHLAEGTQVARLRRRL